MKSSKKVVILTIFLLLVLPPIVYFYVTRGFNTFMKLEVVGEKNHKIAEFSFINQNSEVVNNDSFKGNIYITNFFFTSCPTICPTMTNQMKRLSVLTKDLIKEIQFLSFSINPRMDQPSRLRAYKKKYGIAATNWMFLTGDENKTHALGVEYFQVFANKDIASEGGYAHSPAFVLVDKEGYVRGVYVGTETSQVNQLEKDVRKLLKYEYNVEYAEKK